MSNELTPPSSINDLRTQAHLLLSARLQALDLKPLLVYALTDAPTSILPYLIWQFDMATPAAAFYYFGVTELQLAQIALQYHQYAGSVQTLLNALTLCGYPGCTILEGQSSWGGSFYPSNQGWAAFRVHLVTGTHSPTDLANLTTIINFFKPARCILDEITY